jgi:predicted RNA binding protein YcfA (HicA-like mRNA interferase family)
MPNLKRLSGKDIIKALEAIGFSVTRQKGSHVRLSRFSLDGGAEHVTIPNHDEIDKGTEKSIIRSLKPFVTEEQIQTIFYTM